MCIGSGRLSLSLVTCSSRLNSYYFGSSKIADTWPSKSLARYKAATRINSSLAVRAQLFVIHRGELLLRFESPYGLKSSSDPTYCDSYLPNLQDSPVMPFSAPGFFKPADLFLRRIGYLYKEQLFEGLQMMIELPSLFLPFPLKGPIAENSNR